MASREYKKDWYNQNKIRLNQKSQIYYSNNKEKLDLLNKNWAKKHPEETKKIKEKYRNENREILRKASRERMIEYRKTINAKYSQYKLGAKRRGLIFELTLNEFIELTKNSCFYCGSEGFGIDRLDNTIGYLKENCVPCCSICNRMKFQYSVDDFIDHCRKVAEYGK